METHYGKVMSSGHQRNAVDVNRTKHFQRGRQNDGVMASPRLHAPDVFVRINCGKSDMTAQDSYETWRERYRCQIEAYEQMSIRREAKKCEKKRQEREDARLWALGAYERAILDRQMKWEELPPCLQHGYWLVGLFFDMHTYKSMPGTYCPPAQLFLGALVRMLTRGINQLQTRILNPARYRRELEARRHEEQCRENLERAKAQRRRLRGPDAHAPLHTPDEVREAWTKVMDSRVDMIRFGSIIHDLECHVDNSLMFDEAGNIAGRRGGLREWLPNHIPELAVRYKTIMRYKAMAKRCRIALGLKEDEPIDFNSTALHELLGDGPATQTAILERLKQVESRMS